MVQNLPQNKNESDKRVRPLFLTVLCIISYLSSALILWNSIGNMGENADDESSQNALISTIGAVLTIIGTVLMWNTRVFGFWLFFAGTAAIIAGAIVLFGIEYLKNPETGYSAYLSTVLLVLFAVHYKYMD
ncbi:MAG: hypothetical protein IT243_03200 [Bacteroidia bacterium]|nr:hypothetical protein [Bacteroidia bacterium]